MSDFKNQPMGVPVPPDDQLEYLIFIWDEYYSIMEQIDRQLPHHPSRLGKSVIPDRTKFSWQRNERYREALEIRKEVESYDRKKSADARVIAARLFSEQLEPCPCRTCWESRG